MASMSLPARQHRILDGGTVQAVAEEVVLEQHPGIDTKPRKFYGFILATAALVQPDLEALAQAYRHACRTPTGRLAALYFLSVVLDTESEN